MRRRRRRVLADVRVHLPAQLLLWAPGLMPTTVSGAPGTGGRKRRARERANRHARARSEALHLTGRITVAVVFVASAVAKAAAFDPHTAGRLGGVFWVSVLLEVACGALLLVGLWTRRAALVLLLWLGVGLVLFHGDLGVEMNRAFTLANLAIAGGLFSFVARGGGLWSVDHWRRAKRASSVDDPGRASTLHRPAGTADRRPLAAR